MVMLVCAVPYVAQVGEYGRLKAQLLAQEELQVCSTFGSMLALTATPVALASTTCCAFAAYGLAINLSVLPAVCCVVLQASLSAKVAELDSCKARVGELELRLAQAMDQEVAHSQRLATLQVGGLWARLICHPS